jgi:hypothetical protein
MLKGLEKDVVLQEFPGEGADAAGYHRILTALRGKYGSLLE